MGDFLIWNENLDNPRVGGKAMVDLMQTRAKLNDGFTIEYALGLTVTEYRGIREVSHGGSAPGYQTFLACWPEERLSVVVLCNTTGATPSAYAHQIADLFLAGKLNRPKAVKPVDVPADSLGELAGVYREKLTDAILRMAFDTNEKTVRVGGQLAVPTAANVLSTQYGERSFAIDDRGPSGATRITESDGGRSKPRIWEREPAFSPTLQQLAAYAGDYACEELGGLV